MVKNQVLLIFGPYLVFWGSGVPKFVFQEIDTGVSPIAHKGRWQ